MATSRERLHEIVDSVPESRLIDAEAALERFADPVLLAFLSAPEDDEPTTVEDLAALDEARTDYERGETVSVEDVMTELSNKSGV